MWASSYIRPLGQHSLFASQDASSINRLNVRVRVKVVYCTWKLTTIIMTVTPLIYWIICKYLCFHGVGNVCGHVTVVVQRWRIKQELKNHRKFFLVLQFFVSFLVFYKFCFVLFLNSAGETNVWPLIHFKALSLALSPPPRPSWKPHTGMIQSTRNGHHNRKTIRSAENDLSASALKI